MFIGVYPLANVPSRHLQFESTYKAKHRGQLEIRKSTPMKKVLMKCKFILSI